MPSPESFGKFDPYNPAYKHVKDLPSSMQKHFVDVPEKKGGGFVRKSVGERSERVQEWAKEEAGKERNKASFFKRLFHTVPSLEEFEQKYLDRAIAEDVYHAETEVPVEALIEQAVDLGKFALHGEAWEAMKARMKNPDDYLIASKDPGCDGPSLNGSIGGSVIDFHICGHKGAQPSYGVGGSSLKEEEGAALLDKMWPLAFNQTKMYEAERQLEKDVRERVMKKHGGDESMTNSAWRRRFDKEENERAAKHRENAETAYERVLKNLE